ncbi:MAG: hypothetical protein KBS55_05635, partial [Bacteroidales bacterium]|nr:hypothetical protein [Candidatus Cryptobacteroides aphodequi]
GYIKAVYNNFVIVASTDDYSYKDNTLSFNIQNWTFLAEIQVVVKGIPYYYDATYKLSCDKFTPVNRAGFTVGTGDITAATATEGGAVKGISNADGVAFVFATADYSLSSTNNKDFTFTLTDDITGSEVTKVYKPNVAIEAKPNKSSIKALTIDISNFEVPAN